MVRNNEQLVNDLCAARAEVERLTGLLGRVTNPATAVEGVGERLASILRPAYEDAERLRAEASEDAARLRAAAAADAMEMNRRAERDRDGLDAAAAARRAQEQDDFRIAMHARRVEAMEALRNQAASTAALSSLPGPRLPTDAVEAAPAR
jgi:regulator of protease activity HflC (stomatin/prohibitin superfamily)